jgi:uncharacterized membrane protein
MDSPKGTTDRLTRALGRGSLATAVHRRATARPKVALAITALGLFGVRSWRRRNQHGKGQASPLHLTASTTVNKDPQEVYAFWRDLENLPTFMLHLQSVTKTSDGRWHWVANAPVKSSVAWEAEMTGDEPGRRISWRSLPGADIDNSGTVHFAPAPDGKGTEVRVVLHYGVPGGRLGRAVAMLLGEEPGQQVRDDLRRFKQVLETGDIVRSDALPHGTDARHQLLQRDAKPKKDSNGRSHR